jgi:hypothetical protein
LIHLKLLHFQIHIGALDPFLKGHPKGADEGLAWLYGNKTVAGTVPFALFFQEGGGDEGESMRPLFQGGFKRRGQGEGQAIEFFVKEFPSEQSGKVGASVYYGKDFNFWAEAEEWVVELGHGFLNGK